jgi:predicted permease
MRFYRLLLYFYPAAFRAEYGEELRALFNERRRDATSLLARLLLWLNTIADILVSAAQTHWDIARQDIRYAARMLARSPGFTITAILVAALGIGANTAVFSITDHVLVRPLPFAGAARLVNVWEDRSTIGYPRLEPSPPNYHDWKQMATTFETLAAYRGLSVNLVANGAPERLDGASITADLLPMLGVRPALGRLFTADDDRQGAAGTLLLSHRFWVQRFASDPNIVGRTLRLDGEQVTVIGVMPPDFYFPRRDVLVWTPMRFTANDYSIRQNYYLNVIGKLRTGVTIDQARAELSGIAAQLERMYPNDNQHAGVRVSTPRDDLFPGTRLMLFALLAASLGVLLIACTNLANLLLARALMRRKEIALRAVLGAGRERLVRQLLTESLMLAGSGGVLGVLLAMIGMPLLVRLVPNSLPIADTPTLDLRVLAMAFVITMLTGLGFGAMPAIRACRPSAEMLHEGSRAGVGGRRERLRGTLVVTAIAVSAMLTISTGLLIRALWRLQGVDPGFNAEGVLTLRTSLPMPQYAVTADRERFAGRVLADVRALPGVTSAAYISFVPMVFRGGIFPVVPEGQAEEVSEARQASVRFVTPGFFQTMQIPLRRGRDVRDADTANAARIAVVSESFARRHWPGLDPLGRRFTFLDEMRTVVGVVGDVRVRGFERESEPQVYMPHAQMADRSYTWFAVKDLAIRTSVEPHTLMPSIRAIVSRADPLQPISDVRTMTEIVADQTGVRTAQIRVLGVFAAVAFLLAGIGIHGLLSFAVSHRAQEIGVRMAMGAEMRDILRLILGESLTLACVGIAVGAVLAYVAGRALQTLLAGISPADPPAFGFAIATALVMTIAGSALPALRAVRVDPMAVIRSE